jgi:hypothetical protein
MSITDERLKELIAKYQLGAGYASECASNDQVGVTTAGEANLMFVDVAAALEELLSLRRSQWRPIESAPIGTHILVRAKLFGEWGVFSVIKYQGVNIHGHPFKGFSVTGCGCQEGGTDFDEPTHWMPPPPKDSV